MCKLKSRTSKGLVELRNNSLFSVDAVLLLDEIYIQHQVQYDGRDLLGVIRNFKCGKAYYAVWMYP